MPKEKRTQLKKEMLACCRQSVFELVRGNFAANPKIKNPHIAACWLVFHYVNEKFNFVFSEDLDDANIESVIKKVYSN